MARIIFHIILLVVTALMMAFTGEETAIIEVPEPAADEDDSSPFIGTFCNLTALNGADLVTGTIN
jgi:hypothetical protein